MANTTFIDKETRIEASWCQDMNDFKYVLFDGATTKAQAAEAIGAIRVEGAPTNGQVPVWSEAAGVWVPGAGGGGGDITNPLVIEDNTGVYPEIIFKTNEGTASISFDPQAQTLRFAFALGPDSREIAFTFTGQGVATATGSSPNWSLDPI